MKDTTMTAQTADDKRKIEAYRKTLGKYPKPSLTADIVAVRPAYGELGEGQWRENPEFALEVLFIKRGQWPFEGSWALPGGFIRPTETVDEGARRELREETALEAVNLIPVGVFSRPGRDMRAWIISNAFVSVHRRGQGCHVKGGDDAREAKWLTVKAPVIERGRFQLPFYDEGRPVFRLTGTYREEDLGGGLWPALLQAEHQSGIGRQVAEGLCNAWASPCGGDARSFRGAGSEGGLQAAP